MSQKTQAAGLFDQQDHRRCGDRTRCASSIRARWLATLSSLSPKPSRLCDRPVCSRPRDGQRRERCSPARSPPGSGSPCCSPISPKQWRKAAARRRPTRCAARAPTRAPTAMSTTICMVALQGVNALDLRLGDVVLVKAGEVIPGRRRDHRRRRLRQRNRRSPANPRQSSAKRAATARP